MAATAAALCLRRILVAVDASPLSLAALDAGALLARRLGATLDGVYVEDVNLARLTDHPDVTVVSFLHGRHRPDHHRVIGQALKLQQAAARRAFEAMAARCSAPAGFHVRQGRVATELLAAAGEADLLILGWHGGEETARPRPLGTLARTLVDSGAGPLLLLLRRPLGDRPRFTAPPDDAAALALAQALAGIDRVAEIPAPGDAGRDHLLITSRRDGLDGLPCSALLLSRR